MLHIIDDRSRILNTLRCMDENKKPAFGIMSPRHMVEHLALVMRFSNGKEPQVLHTDEEKAAKGKHIIIHSNRELPRGARLPVLPEGLQPLRHSSLAEAVDELQQELDAFDDYFRLNEEAVFFHPVMGAFDHKDWIIFHNKHFHHHFGQFELTAPESGIRER